MPSARLALSAADERRRRRPLVNSAAKVRAVHINIFVRVMLRLIALSWPLHSGVAFAVIDDAAGRHIVFRISYLRRGEKRDDATLAVYNCGSFFTTIYYSIQTPEKGEKDCIVEQFSGFSPLASNMSCLCMESPDSLLV